MLSGQSNNVNVHNADSTTGRLGAGQSISMTLATEDKAVLDAIAAAIGAANIDVTLSSRASEATRLLIKAKTDNLDATLSSRATEATLATRASEATLAALNAKFGAIGQQAAGSSVSVVIAAGFTVAVSAASLPLPTGAATEATLATRASEATLAALNAKIGSIGQQAAGSSVSVVIASAFTVPVSAASLPLPTGATTEATLATRVADATITARLGVLGQAVMAASAPVVIASNQSAIPVSQSGSWNVTLLAGAAAIGSVTVSASALPTGASTEATLLAIKAKTDLVTFVNDRIKVMRDDFTGYDSTAHTTASLAALASANNDVVVPNGEVWHIIGVSFAREFTTNGRKQTSALKLIWDPATANKTIAALRSQGNTENADVGYKVTGNGVKVLRMATTNGADDASVHDIVVIYRVA